ncbi:MAG: hypothetical protein P8010_15215 [Desulfosarcinaceae bacterium]
MATDDVFDEDIEDRGPDDDLEHEMVVAHDKHFNSDRWHRAMALKRDMPLHVLQVTDPGPGRLKEAGKNAAGLFLSESGGKVRVKSAGEAKEKRSFGLLDAVAEVVADRRLIDGTLMLPYDPEKLGYVVRESLRLFRFDDKKGRYLKVPGSQSAMEGHYVYGRIRTPGVYAVIGLHGHPLVLGALRNLCLYRAVIRATPERLRQGLVERLCQVILCPPDLWEAMKDPRVFDDFARIGARDGLPMPGMTEDLPRPSNRHMAAMQGNICEQCLGGFPGGVPPECEILEEYPPSGGGGACADSGWQTVGPKNLAGCILQVVVDPTDSDRLYCAAADGGVWRLDGISAYPTVTWRPLTDQLDTLRMSAVAVAPSNGQVVYTATRTGVIFRSADRGENWEQRNTAALGYVRRLLVHPSQADTLFAASNSGCHFSDDGGETWDNRYAGNVLDARMDPQDSSILYIAVRNIGVLKTYTLGFGPWETILQWSSADAPVSQMIKLALGYRNSDGTLQSDADRTVVAKLGNEVFVNQEGGRAAGGGWVSKGKHGGNGYGNWCHVVGVDPFDPDVILAGQQELFRTDNGGTSWTKVARYYRPHEDQQSIAFDRNHRDVAYLSNDGGVFRSDDGGITWWVEDETVADAIANQRSLVKDMVTAQFYRVGVHGNHAVGNLYHSGIIASSSLTSGQWRGIEGHAWEFNYVFADEKRPGRYYFFHSKLNARRFPGTGSGDHVRFADFRPYTAGSSTSRPVGAIAVDTRSASETILVGAYSDDSSGYRLMITTNGDRWPVKQPDDTWDNLPDWEVAIDNANDPLVSIEFAPSTPGKAYTISSAGRVFTKDEVNAAGDWTETGQWGENGVRQLAIDGTDAQLLYAITADQVGRSENGGATWTTVGGASLPASEFNSVVAHPDRPHRLYLGADIGVFVSDDRGDSWTPFDQDLPNAEILQIFWKGSYLYAVTYGRGLWRRRPC